MLCQIRRQIAASISSAYPRITDLIVILRAIRLIEAVVAVERGDCDFCEGIVHNATARLTESLDHRTVRDGEILGILVIGVIVTA